jgi:hypothetical protein
MSPTKADANLQFRVCVYIRDLMGKVEGNARRCPFPEEVIPERVKYDFAE